MRKFILLSIFFILIIFSSALLALSTIGIETKRFNNLILTKVNQINENVNIKINTIRFKLDVKALSLFLETTEPKIYFKESLFTTKKIKVYVDFFSILKASPKITRVNIFSNEIDIKEFKQLAALAKPSNIKSFIKNNINKGEIIFEIELFLNNNNFIDNFIVRGNVKKLNSQIGKNLLIKNTSFEFFGDNSDILLKKINGELQGAKLEDGDLRLEISNEININSNFLINLKYQNIYKKNYLKIFKDFNYFDNLDKFDAILKNNLFISLDKTFKVKNFKFDSTGNVSSAVFLFKKELSYDVFDDKVKKISFIDTKVSTNFTNKIKKINLDGKYFLNSSDQFNYNLDGDFNADITKLNINVDIGKKINLSQINYVKEKNLISTLSLNLVIKKNLLNIKKMRFNEKKNIISANDVIIKNKKLVSFKNIAVKTFDKNGLNNDFSITNKKKIKIKGKNFDALNIPKIMNTKRKNNFLANISKEIDIELDNIAAPLSENLSNFKLLGTIENGKFVKISSKGDFGNSNFLDISMKNDKNSSKRYLEIYSDLTSPLLTEFNFFKGLVDGKLFYSSIIEGDDFDSKLKIENFKVQNAPGLVKLLSLADLGGLADLAKGDGLSFDSLDIDLSRKKGFLKLNEILALGPSISVLMEGYQDQNRITSLRGTLVPAKNLNKLISKIPVIGNIVIPKEVGEGLFGISFKMKGPPGEIKTSINPIRTITPRFIQKIIDRRKKSK